MATTLLVCQSTPAGDKKSVLTGQDRPRLFLLTSERSDNLAWAMAKLVLEKKERAG